VQHEYAYGPAQGLATTKIAAFTQALDVQVKRISGSLVSNLVASPTPVTLARRTTIE
jgi:hypothetical protein